MITNPVLTGFHPDPSMIFVDGMFYIANSTFEYYPGVRISKSSDLANWETVGCALTHQFDPRGALHECGIWAPCLSYCDGTYYLVFTDVKTASEGPHKDTPNYIVTAKSIEGPWSEPIYVNSSGFDPSLFHDDDGRKYLVNMEWDYRKPGREKFTGILLTELNPQTLLPVTSAKRIFPGTSYGITEGPHLYKKDGYYYLVMAEGGTSYGHAVTVARAREVNGSYETQEQPILLTARETPESPLQKCGHGSICQDANGRWWVAFLCGRPMAGTTRCNLGRETAIAELIWEEGQFPRLKAGGIIPPLNFEGYGEQRPLAELSCDFSGEQFYKEFNSLRGEAEYEVLQSGALRLFGKEFINSRNVQNLLVTRQRAASFVAETAIVNPHHHFKCFGGLTLRYSESNQYYLQFVWDEARDSNVLQVLRMDGGRFDLLDCGGIAIDGDTVHLRLTVEEKTGRFSYSMDGKTFTPIDFELDTTILSDEQDSGFTGSMVGIAASDLEYNRAPIDFLYFRYKNLSVR